MSAKELLDAFSRPGDKKKVFELLPKTAHRVAQVKGNDGRTLLHWAAMRGWTDVCRHLVTQYHVNIHARDKTLGDTALHDACRSTDHNYETVCYLVQKCCADPLARNKTDQTPLDVCVWKKSRIFLQEIIESSKQQGYADITEYLKQKRAGMLTAKAMSQGSGNLDQCNILFHGPPGAGKSSVKCLILGQPARPKHLQNATDIVEDTVRTVCVSRVAASKHLKEVSNEEIMSRIAVEVQKLEENMIPNASTNISETEEAINDCSAHTDQSVITKEIENKLIKLDTNTKNDCLFDSQWLHHIDSGGQPQFLDVFPLLYDSPSHFVVVIRLTEGLDTKPKVRFYNKGDEYSLPSHLVLSNREMIIQVCQIAQRISQAECGKFKPQVIIVGTHLDKLKNKSRCIKEIDEQLAPIHRDYCDVMICSSNSRSHNQYIFPVNAMSKGKERQEFTESIQKLILLATKEMCNPVKVPLKWMTFHLELEKFEEGGAIRMINCIKVGEKLNMSKEKVHNALEYLKKAALVLYYPDDVPDLVLIKMDPFTNRLSRLIKATFIPPDQKPAQELYALQEKGVFSKSFLRRVFADLDESILSDEEFLKLIVKLKIAVKIDENTYFIPSALSLECPNPKKTFACQSNPLALLWDELILPHGFFPTICVEMLDKSGREEGYIFGLCNDSENSPWRGEIQFFEVNAGIPGVIILTDRQKWIQVSYSGDKSYCPKVYHVVTSAIQCAIERLKHTGIVVPTIGYLCPLNCQQSNEDHYCKISDDKQFITCWNNKAMTGPVNEDISCWFIQDTVQSATFSSTDQLTVSEDHVDDRILQVDDLCAVLSEIVGVSNWMPLGLALGLKDYVLEDIREDESNQDNKRRAMMSQWLKTGKASWKGLVTALLHPLVRKETMHIAEKISKEHFIEH